MALNARPDKGYVDDRKFCILQLLTKNPTKLKIGQTDSYLCTTVFYVTIRVALASSASP